MVTSPHPHSGYKPPNSRHGIGSWSRAKGAPAAVFQRSVVRGACFLHIYVAARVQELPDLFEPKLEDFKPHLPKTILKPKRSWFYFNHVQSFPASNSRVWGRLWNILSPCTGQGQCCALLAPGFMFLPGFIRKAQPIPQADVMMSRF